MKPLELRRKSNKELQQILKGLREDLRKSRFNLVGGKIKDIKQIRKLKSDIARVLTVLKEK